MSVTDPLAGLAAPTCDPAAARETGQRYRLLGRDLSLAAAALRRSVADGTASTVWIGAAAMSAADTGARLAGAYEQTAGGASSAAAALTTCSDEWERALSTWRQARSLADDAVREETARAVAPEPGTALLPAAWVSPDRARACSLARTALGDIEAASAACARRLDQATGALVPAAPVPPPDHRPWWDHGPLGAVVHTTDDALHFAGDVLDEIATNPGAALSDLKGIGVGTGLMLLGAAVEVGSSGLDILPGGQAVGVAGNVWGARVAAVGARTTLVAGAQSVRDLGHYINEARAGESATGGSGGGASGGSSVDEVLAQLRSGRTPPNLEVDTPQKMENVFDQLSRGGTPVESGYPGKMVLRDDGTRVGLRRASKSGGETIDVFKRDGTHIKVHLP